VRRLQAYLGSSIKLSFKCLIFSFTPINNLALLQDLLLQILNGPLSGSRCLGR